MRVMTSIGSSGSDGPSIPGQASMRSAIVRDRVRRRHTMDAAAYRFFVHTIAAVAHDREGGDAHATDAAAWAFAMHSAAVRARVRGGIKGTQRVIGGALFGARIRSVRSVVPASAGGGLMWCVVRPDFAGHVHCIE